MKYTTNIDTLSALLDRLISENIKLYFFKKENLQENTKHQEEVIEEIKERLKKLFVDVFWNKKYNYVSEKRTYKADLTLEALETLIKSDIYTGEGDRANLEELNKEDPNLNAFRKNHKVLRSANELRAVSKNDLDKRFKDFVEDENKD
jgi:kynurenine formamidase